MGGMAPLVWDGQARTFGFTAILGEPGERGAFSYDLDLARLGESGSYNKAKELICVTKRGARVELVPAGDFADGETLLFQVGRDETEAYPFKQMIQSWTIHRDMRTDQRAELRGTSISRQERRVKSDGQNLIAVLHTLYPSNRNFTEFLDKAMSAAFPNDYEKLVFPPEANGRVELRVQRKHRKYDDSSADLSDGTLRFLLLMTILGSPDPAPLIAIDEPETGLHPRMMSIVAEVAENAARKSQIIFSTHSPSFLDAFDDEPPTTTIVTMEGSETVLKTIAGEELKRWIEDYSLSKFVFSGEADAVL